MIVNFGHMKMWPLFSYLVLKGNFMESLKKNESFQSVFNNVNRKSFGNKYLVMYVSENNQDFNRIGITVSKKVGNSVVRHRLKRLIKESYRLHEVEFNSGLDVVIVARVNANTVKKCMEIESAMMHLAKHLDILVK